MGCPSRQSKDFLLKEWEIISYTPSENYKGKEIVTTIDEESLSSLRNIRQNSFQNDFGYRQHFQKDNNPFIKKTNFFITNAISTKGLIMIIVIMIIIIQFIQTFTNKITKQIVKMNMEIIIINYYTNSSHEDNYTGNG